MTRRFVVAYFSLAADDSIEEYRTWALSTVRPVMRALPSVLSFMDFAVVGAGEGATNWYDGCEIIEVSDFAAFERDDSTGEAALLGAQWRERTARYEITYLSDLETLGA